MKKTFAILFAIMLAGQVWAASTTFEVGGLKYTVTDETNHYVSVGKGTSQPSGALQILETVTYPETDGVKYTVTSIAVEGFYFCGRITSITIPNSVTSIGKSAFHTCNDLTSVTIPNSVTTIASSAFYSCRNLKSVTIPESVKTIESSAFGNCGNLTSITIPDGVTTIGDAAFGGCTRLQKVSIGNSVTRIGKNAFAHTGLHSITLPSSITSMGENVFDFSVLSELKYNTNAINRKVISGILTLNYVTIGDNVTSIEDSLFFGNSSLLSVNIGSSVERIGKDAFLGCNTICEINVSDDNTNYSSENGIVFNKDKTTIICYPKYKDETSYTIPNSVTSIGDCAFRECNRLTSITIPSSVKSIGEYAFSACSRLKSVIIPNSVKIIDNYVFKNCSGLTFMVYEGKTAPSIGTSVFEGVDSSIKVCVPEEYGSSSFGGLGIYKGHNKVTDQAVPATCTESGLTEGLHCSNCGKVLVAQEVIPALQHNYGTPTYDWNANNASCTATKVCANDSEHVISETVDATSAVTVVATCEETGTRTFTANFTEEGFVTQQTTEVIAATGHNYNVPTYNWSNGHSACTATKVCTNNNTHIITETAVSAVVMTATCEEAGTKTFTANFTKEGFETQQVIENIAALGHDWSEWQTTVASTCSTQGTQVRTCSRNAEHTESQSLPLDANNHEDVVTDDAVAATTTSTGLTEGSHCSACHTTIVAQTEIPALGEQGGENQGGNNEGGNNQGGENQGGNNEGGNNQGGENQGGNNEGGNNQGGENQGGNNEGGNNQGGGNNNPGTAVDDVIAETVSIYTIDGNTIVVENATEEIRIYDAMGRLICRDATPCVRAEMNVNVSGIYIVRVGYVAKRIMLNQ